jgi:hypothetical protein
MENLSEMFKTALQQALSMFVVIGRFYLNNMKKVISTIILITALICGIGLVIYTLYIKPLSEIKGLDKWYEYALVITIFTVIYGLIILAFKGVFKLIDWAASNVG